MRRGTPPWPRIVRGIAAQLTRVYDEYLGSVAATSGGALPYYAVRVVGPRNRVDRIVGRLALL